MLIPFYWVLKTSLTGENIYAYPRASSRDPHLFNYVDVWYLIPFLRYLLNSVIVTAMAIAGNLLFKRRRGLRSSPRISRPALGHCSCCRAC
jgi:ABC-type glycerol-3-phosphate transport system permease component